jgi:hypothetical protein
LEQRPFPAQELVIRPIKLEKILQAQAKAFSFCAEKLTSLLKN